MVWVAMVAAGALVLTGCVVGETGDPEVIANSSVTLTGTVMKTDGTSGTASYWFEYGTTDGYGQSSPHALASVQYKVRARVSVRISGLVPETTYHYRLCSRDQADGAGICGADRIVTTSGDRDSVSGSGEYPLPIAGYNRVDVLGSAGPGYVEGTGTFSGSFFGYPSHTIDFSGTGPVVCIRAEGNNAVVGFLAYDELLGDISQLVYIQDNGATGDLFGLGSWEDRDSGCPAPDPSLATHAGDFVVEDG